MIPKRYIDEWRSQAPWPGIDQVEQEINKYLKFEF